MRILFLFAVIRSLSERGDFSIPARGLARSVGFMRPGPVVCGPMLSCIAYTVLHSPVLSCAAPTLRSAVLYSPTLRSAILYSPTLRSAVLYSPTLSCAALHCAPLVWGYRDQASSRPPAGFPPGWSCPAQSCPPAQPCPALRCPAQPYTVLCCPVLHSPTLSCPPTWPYTSGAQCRVIEV